MEIRITILLIFFSQSVYTTDSEENVIKAFENKLVYKLGDITYSITKMLAEYNNKNLGSSEWGRTLGYNALKPNLLEDNGRDGRNLKKMSMSLMPLIFHVGAASTWMLITSIMAAKSVAIGLLLLLFKIAVSSAKVASFFTLLKSKHADHHHHEAWSWSPPHGHETHDRSLSNKHNKDLSSHDDWSSYNPEWSPSEHHSSSGYKTIPIYKDNTITAHYDEVEYEDSKPPKADKRYG